MEQRGATVIAHLRQHQRELEALCRRFGVRRLELFGSAATGAFQEASSDLDFLVEFAEPLGPGYADRYLGLLEALEVLFARPVDLIVTSAIKNPYFQQSVDATRVLLYAA
jgi:predicted nucleotidyltransferase